MFVTFTTRPRIAVVSGYQGVTPGMPLAVPGRPEGATRFVCQSVMMRVTITVTGALGVVRPNMLVEAGTRADTRF
jgi:hypothetical protein